jgi:hypothetical protein
MTNMTAVEWLVNELNNQKCWADPARIEIIVQQALEMEKQQIIDANIAGLIYPYVPGKPFGLEIAEQSKAEQYYSETYKSNNL